jgi:hypothetical protein
MINQIFDECFCGECAADDPRKCPMDTSQNQPPCKCDLDRWEPEKDTGHTWICPVNAFIKAQEAAK